jgi:hypothetical protein
MLRENTRRCTRSTRRTHADPSTPVSRDFEDLALLKKTRANQAAPCRSGVGVVIFKRGRPVRVLVCDSH